MNNKIRRSSLRDCYEASIFIADKSSGDYHNAVMYNSSRDGMYFETSCQIADGQDVYVKLDDKATQIMGEDKYREYLAKVKWCRTISSGEEKPCFGLGIHFLNGLQDEFEHSLRDCSLNCDKCGVNVLPEQTHKTENSLNLCQQCYKKFESYPEGELKSCIENYLMGNIF